MSILQHNYLGRKGGSGVAEWIINKMPKHDVYIECFLGHGVILYKKEPASINIGIEKDKDLCPLHTHISMLPGSIDKNNYRISKEIIFDDVFSELPKQLNSFMMANKVICVYLDPPYLPETRSDYARTQYKYELDYSGHIKILSMLEQFKSKNVFFLISGYKSELYMSMLEEWQYFEFQTMSRGGVRTESLWTSFNPDEYVKHDYNYVGSDYTDRQRIKRKIDRWVKKINSLEFDERQALLQALGTL